MMNGTPPRSKPLPSRPSPEKGYRDGGMANNYRNESPRNYNSTNGRSGEASGKVVLDGYRQEIMNGFETDKPRFNPVSFIFVDALEADRIR